MFWFRNTELTLIFHLDPGPCEFQHSWKSVSALSNRKVSCARINQPDLRVEGLFRKNGNIRRLKEFCEQVSSAQGSASLMNDNPIQIAALMKKFFRDLPEPLLTFKLSELFIFSQSNFTPLP
jgi:hypothetical protein